MLPEELLDKLNLDEFEKLNCVSLEEGVQKPEELKQGEQQRFKNGSDKIDSSSKNE